MIQAPQLREPADEPLRPDRLRVERDRTVAAEQAAGCPPCGRPARDQRHHVGAPLRRSLVRPAGVLRALHDLLQPLQSLAQERAHGISLWTPS